MKCCECCWAAAAASEVSIGGGLGLFLCALDGDKLLDALEDEGEDDVGEDADGDIDVVVTADWLLLATCTLDDVVVFVDAVVTIDIGQSSSTAVEPRAIDDFVVTAVDVEVVDEAEEPPPDCALLTRSDIMVLLLTSQLLGDVGGEVEVGEAEAELELATELQLPVLRDRSVGSFSFAEADA